MSPRKKLPSPEGMRSDEGLLWSNNMDSGPAPEGETDPELCAARAAQKGRSDEASDGEASSSGGGGGTFSAKRPAGSEGTAGAASVSGSTFQARMSLYQRPL